MGRHKQPLGGAWLPRASFVATALSGQLFLEKANSANTYFLEKNVDHNILPTGFPLLITKKLLRVFITFRPSLHWA